MNANFSNFFQKILLSLTLSIAIIGFGANFAFADAPTTQTPGIPTFSVGTYLTVSDKKANGEYGNNGEQNQSYLKSSNPIASFVLQIINFIALTVASVSFLAIVLGGFLMMSSAGNDNQITKGKAMITQAIVGLVITLSAYFIVSFVQNMLFETVSK